MNVDLSDIAGTQLDASCPFTNITIEPGDGTFKVLFSNNGKLMFSMKSPHLIPGDSYSINGIKGTIDVKINLP
jgi:hypothetical protein